MEIISTGTVGGIPLGDALKSKTFPAFEILPSGRWLAGFKASEKKADARHKSVWMTWSDDQGASWVPAFVPVELPEVSGRVGQAISLYFLTLGGSRVLLVINWVDESDPEAPFYDPADESLKDTRIFWSISEDSGAHWSVPQLIDTTGLGGPAPLTGPPILLGDGSLLCQLEINKYKGDPAKWVHRSAMLRSIDGGVTWPETHMVTDYPDWYFWDQRPNVLQDGRTLVNYFWTLDGKRNEYLNVHEAISSDGGASWCFPIDTGIYGQPGRPVQLDDGRIVLICIDRSVVPVISLWIKDDLESPFTKVGDVFQADLARQDSRYVTMNEAWAEMARFSIGHPQLLHLGGSEVLAYFYAGSKTNHTEINYVHISLK
jgi:hypothetical protein